jgi:hypothetical protein
VTRRWPSIALLLLLLLIPARGAAQPADELLRQALERYAAADFQGSVQLLQQARQVATEPGTLARIQLYLGVNHEVLGDPVQAEQAFRAALVHDPVLVIDPQRFRASAVALFTKVRASLTGRLEVRAPGDVKVEIDGAPAGSGAVTRQLPIGPHEVKLRAKDGRVLLARSVLIAPDQTVTVNAPASQPASTRPASARPASQPASRPALPRPLKPAPVSATAPRRRRIWTWVAAGGAAASLAVAIGLGASASADHGEWEEVWEAGEDQKRWDDLAASGQGKELAANVLFGVAGVLAITAAVLYFLEGAQARNDKRAARAGRGLRAGVTGLTVPF